MKVDIFRAVQEAKKRDEAKPKPFWVKCSKCSHVWEAGQLPAMLRTFSKGMKKVKCPKCGAGSSEIMIAKQNNGVLLEKRT